MKRSTFHIILAAALIAVASTAYTGTGPGTGADPSETTAIYGAVVSFTASPGSGMPMLTVDDDVLGTVDVALGPIWFVQAAEFGAAPGDLVELEAFQCATCAAPFVAVWVRNLTTDAFIELRDETTGKPLWIQRQSARGGSGRPGQGQGNGQGGGQGGGTGQPGGSGNGTGNGPDNGSGLDMSQVTTVAGTVLDFVGHAGSGQPLLTLDVAGDTVEIVVSPYQPIAAAGWVIEAGMELEVTFAPTDCDDNPQNVSIALYDPVTGLSIQLRDPETGFPISTGGGHNRPDWP